MDKDCCNVKFSETDEGYRIDVNGTKVKEIFKSMMENCNCDEKSWQEVFKNCCPSPSKS